MSEPMKKMQFANIDISNTLADDSYFAVIQNGETYKIPKAKIIEAVQGESTTAISRIYINNGHLYFVMTDDTEYDAGAVNERIEQYGVCYDHSSKNPTLTRLGAAVGLVAETGVGTQKVQNDFDNIYPWCDMRRCTLADDGTVTAYKGDVNYVQDGSIGQVMVEIPKFYIKRIHNAETDKYFLYICKDKLEGYRLPKVFEGPDNSELSHIYVGAFMSDSSSGKAESKANTYEVTWANYLNTSAYHKRANGWHCIDGPMLWEVLQPLFMIEFATLDSESVFSGLGDIADYEYYAAEESISDSSNIIVLDELTDDEASRLYVGQEININVLSQDNNYEQEGLDVVDSDGAYAIRNIVSLTKEAIIPPEPIEGDEQSETLYKVTIQFSGSPLKIDEETLIYDNCERSGVADCVVASSGIPGKCAFGQEPFVWRGIENLFSYYYTMLDGILITSGGIYFTEDIEQYGTTTTPSSSEHYHLSTLDVPSKSGYISQMAFDDEHPWLMFPCEIEGSSEEGYCDKFTKPPRTTSKYPLQFGGDSSAEGGLFCLYSNSAYYINANAFSGRLAYTPLS